MSDGARGFDDSEVSAPHSGVSKTPEGLLGRTIDQRYRVEALLGQGGMGLVYRVTHTRLNKPLAIKVLRRENTKDPEVLARFRREAESASGIGNQHIVDIHDFGELEDGSTYFVMECLEGLDLIDALDVAQRMPEGRAIHIAIQLCRALGAAHDAGIVHRDLKPENVFLIRRDDTEDFVKVLDFGIAKVANGPKRLTRDGEVLGTPHYMSPEQCEGDGVDHRTDIYALGVLLYEMLTGHVPHDADTMMGILTKQMYEDPIPPKVRVPQISEPLEQLIMRCLEKKPEQRYQTMHDIEADLQRIHTGKQPVGPDTVTLKPTRPPAPTHRAVSPIYLGGLAMALLALVGTLAADAYTRPMADVDTASQTGNFAAPPGLEPDAEQPAAAASSDPEVETKAPRAKRLRRHSRHRPKSSPQRDQAILDPWK
ncbi:MAG: serine/threonine protein kinase [Deltaproteobacteria bacterium]|nr:MAG: serine/threonine protein kinase [Deltaproteobacteria bacterium]